MSKKIYTILGLLIAISMILAACAQPTAETIIETVVVEVMSRPSWLKARPSSKPSWRPL